MGKAATVKDVARLAGVSPSTVSRTLNDGYVAPETRLVVEAALKETGFQLNGVAQGLRKQRTLALGHVLLSASSNPFFAGVALGVEREAARHGCGVVTVNTQNDLELERLGVETLIRRRVDAIIITPYVDPANIRLALDVGIPVVQVERPGTVETDTVTIDNYRGSFEATEHLIEHGHHRIAYIGEPTERTTQRSGGSRARLVERERLSGYRDALSSHELPIDEGLISLDVRYDDLASARASTRRLLALPLAQRPSAIFATCDLLAAGVLQELNSLGLRVPYDISLVGYDDTYATHLTPPLTTVEQPMFEIGRVAARLALERLQGSIGVLADGRHHCVTKRLATRLIIRESTGPAPTPAT